MIATTKIERRSVAFTSRPGRTDAISADEPQEQWIREQPKCGPQIEGALRTLNRIGCDKTDGDGNQDATSAAKIEKIRRTRSRRDRHHRRK